VLHVRPDLKVVPMRGNVETRLRKLEQGVADATLLACAGLRRLGLADRITSPIPTDQMLPAVAQGAIGVEIRSEDAAMARLLSPINDEPTALAVTAERAFLAKLEGSCRTPIAGLAELTDGRLIFRGMILTPAGREVHATRREGRPEEALLLAEDAAAELLGKASRDFFKAHS
jgi:hydroxymethylbilane synthase